MGERVRSPSVQPTSWINWGSGDCSRPLGFSPVHEIQISDEGYGRVTTLRREDMPGRGPGLYRRKSRHHRRPFRSDLSVRQHSLDSACQPHPFALWNVGNCGHCTAGRTHPSLHRQVGDWGRWTAVFCGVAGRICPCGVGPMSKCSSSARSPLSIPTTTSAIERFHASGAVCHLAHGPLLSMPDQHRCCIRLDDSQSANSRC